MSVSLVFLLLIKRQFEYDSYHQSVDQLYRVITVKEGEEGQKIYATTPSAITNELNNYPFVEYASHLYKGSHVSVKSTNKELDLDLKFADSSFLEMFHFPLELSNARALSTPNSIILSAEKAYDFWGTSNAIGKTLDVPDIGIFIVTGVFKPQKGPTHFKFDALASSLSMIDSVGSSRSTNWRDLNSGYTYLRLRDVDGTHDLEDVLSRISQRNATFLKSKLDNKDLVSKLSIQAVLDINPAKGRPLFDEMNRGFDWNGILVLAGLVVLLILTAGFNYTGMALTHSIRRATEIGVRKINGATRLQIFAQFVTESVVLTFASLILALLFIPVLSYVNVFYEVLTLLTIDLTALVWIFIFALLVGFIAGGFPAFILSTLTPAAILKGVTNSRVLGKFRVRKILITAQFAITSVFVIIVFIQRAQTRYNKKFDYGFQIKDIVVFHCDPDKITALTDYFRKRSDVEQVAAGSGVPIIDKPSMTTCYFVKSQTIDSLNLEYYSVDQNYIPLLNLSLLAGQNFSSTLNNNPQPYIVLTAKAAQKLHFQSPSDAIGNFVRIDSSSYKVIGVVENFVTEDLKSGSPPLALRLRASEYQTVLVKFVSGYADETIKSVLAMWKGIAPGEPLSYERYDSFVEDHISRQSKDFVLINFLALFILVIACVGLVGVVSYVVESKVREVGIRRVFGATDQQLIWEISREFVLLLSIAACLGLPLGFFIGWSILENYAYRVTLTSEVFLLSLSLLLAVGWIAILSQTYRAIYISATEALKSY